MAKLRPFFFTGANAKIILNHKTVAFATDVSYSVTVNHATPRVLGRFEVETVQPLTYDVTGSLTIIKYAAGMRSELGDVPTSVSDKGNGVKAYDANDNAIASALGWPANFEYDGAPGDNFIPAKMFQSKMFDIEIRQKHDGGDAPIIRLRDCRFTGLDFKLTKRGLPMQTMQFTARYADDDTYIARKSGSGQELV